MYYLGIDLGSSSIKLALVEQSTGKSKAIIQVPDTEMGMESPQNGWAEQNPEDWWQLTCEGITKLLKEAKVNPNEIAGIGIAYQMHGLVLVDKNGKSLRNAIIWCDSRAVKVGADAYEKLGQDYCDGNLLNSPGNFTASKLAWVKNNEPELYEGIYKFMLPGDFIAYRLSGSLNTTLSGLSEGIFWDFKQDGISNPLLKYYEIDSDLIPEMVPNFHEQSHVSREASLACGLQEGTPILYRAGDQPNNALSLNIFEVGEVAATGGTSGVMYAITDNLSVKESSRVNNFAHVNYKDDRKRIGKLLCINGSGIQYRWLMNNLDVSDYSKMNGLASTIDIGSDGVVILPFGNGAERMLLNQNVGTRMLNIDLNRHDKAHLCRASLEGIAFSFVYGFEIMESDGINTKVIRSGNDNLFRSDIFGRTIATLIGKSIEIYDTTGAIGAARACGLKDGNLSNFSIYLKNDYIKTFEPEPEKKPYLDAYRIWKKELHKILEN